MMAERHAAQCPSVIAPYAGYVGLARSIPTVIMLMNFPYRGFDEVWNLHHPP